MPEAALLTGSVWRFAARAGGTPFGCVVDLPAVVATAFPDRVPADWAGKAVLLRGVPLSLGVAKALARAGVALVAVEGAGVDALAERALLAADVLVVTGMELPEVVERFTAVPLAVSVSVRAWAS